MKKYLLSFELLTDIEIDTLLAKAKVKKIKKDSYFIREGSVCSEVAFVIEGLLRSYYHNSIDEEVTYCFCFNKTFIAAYSSFITQLPTIENFQALTDVEMLVFSREDILELEHSSTNFLRLFKYLGELEYVKMEKRLLLLQKEKAEKRYEDLLSNSPEYLQLIPLNHLASYLGITQRHLSRIRSAI